MKKNIAGIPIALLVAAIVIWALSRKKAAAPVVDYSAIFDNVRQYDKQGTSAQPVYGVAGLDY